MGKIIIYIKGGIGNQLFCYAAARRLALANNAELVIDNVTWFVRDYKYQRKYMLDRFQIKARKATSTERLEPFERYRRKLMKWSSGWKPFVKRCYVEQEGSNFDERLLALKVKGTLFLDGYWQSEGYFKDVEQIVREDLQIIPPSDVLNQRMAEEIQRSCAIALHVRWFDLPNVPGSSHYNLSSNYYLRAIEMIEKKIKTPHYFLFSDKPDAACAKLSLSGKRVTVVNNNKGDENAYADLWLMSKCQHFIIANSTFSWWGAWLAEFGSKIVIAPNNKMTGIMDWGFDGLMPNGWILL